MAGFIFKSALSHCYRFASSMKQFFSWLFRIPHFTNIYSC